MGDYFLRNAWDSLNIWRGSGASATGAQVQQCPFCGSIPHQSLGQCPAILKIEYYQDGSIKSVEKKP